MAGNPPPIPENPHGILFTDQFQQDRYNILVNCRIVPTRYIDDNVLNELGLHADIHRMCDRLGWGVFAFLRAPTYELITLEFLCSLTVNLKGVHAALGEIKFRMFNIDYTFTLVDFNNALGLPTGGARGIPPSPDFAATPFWRRITYLDDFDTRTAKATAIHNPCFRYMHRVLSHTVFGRGDSEGSVRLVELYFLWAMTRDYLVDTGAHIAQHMYKLSMASSGSIVIGGLITSIALSLDLDLTNLVPIRGSHVLDLDLCVAIRMIDRIGNSFELYLKDANYTIPLPDIARTTVQDERNWRYLLVAPQGDEEENDPEDDDYLEIEGYHHVPTPPISPHHAHPPPHSEHPDVSLGAIYGLLQSIDSRTRRVEERQEELVAFVHQMHGWHMAQGHFPPLPP